MLHHFLTLSQVCSIVHVCSMYCTRKVRDTNISCKQAIDAYWQPDPNRIQSFDMFVCEWYLTWQVLSERSLREVLFLCLGPRKSKILLQFVLKKSEAKQNNLFDDTSKKNGGFQQWHFNFGMSWMKSRYGGTSKKIVKNTEQNSVVRCHLYLCLCFIHNGILAK